MPIMVIKCAQQLDEMGKPEEFTSDLTDVANADDVSHLTGHGLAKIGTWVRPGMILIGKLGQKKAEGLADMNELEQFIASRDELRAYWQRRIYDASFYAPSGCVGSVVAAYFESGGRQRIFRDGEEASGVAVVEIERDEKVSVENR